jgi:hypothetical protein
MLHSPARFGLLVLACSLAGCGRAKEPASPESVQPGSMPMSPAPGYAAPPPPPAPEAPASTAAEREEAPTFHTLEQAEAALEQAQAELASVWPELGTGKSKAGPAAQAPARRSADEGKAESSAGANADASRCETACRAFSSLERAAGAVCRLAGDGTDRCTRARQLVASNQKRVSHCGCARP